MNTDQRQEPLSLEALRLRDRAEFARMVEANSSLIYRLALKLLNDPQDAEDILQETFIKAYQHLPEFDGRSSLSTWLYRIATNEALMHLRRKQPETVSIEEPQADEGPLQEPLQIVDWCCVPESELMSTEGRAELDRAVETLPPSLKVVFLLRDVAGLSTRETAEALELSEMAVKTRLSRARLRLREELSDYFGEKMQG
ncbi:MAG TPA: sigma-70 family RNA polymerase sigma factor [Anaerolineales bacterium]|nr:sigma-70 family RNA polymerase sigma factor [Anaerolineales bacterium]